jgi:hypothetical protein
MLWAGRREGPCRCGSEQSPALDAGANPNALPFDQRGLPRLNGVDVDIGAFER